jgi:poly-gamma-glutamate synthase PgsB/CapB
LRFLRDLVDANRELFYLYSQNSTWHLIFAVVGFLLLFFGRLALATHRIERARSSIPLVIGGWGTRGKSGTERKKSALFHALGCEVFTKTTGCEAMFIHSVPGQKPIELFIYRPNDKATIWEQRDIIELARKLRPNVFLYECMALNPQYVRLIQEGWMHDDLSTITNTYPDHEDIQGPAGIDLPYVMNEFIPIGKTCFTCEDMFFPVLKQGARRKKTEIVQVGWREGAMIPEDVLDRYPYKVHPMNLAMVVRMAQHLGVERDFALKEIADWIVPDLGVLKVFPIGRHRGRRLEFSNGHSANERRGFNANWVRLGLDRYDPVRDPGKWVVTVINNRADRVPRSKVFADAMVKDVRCHRHMCIGTNLTGLRGFVEAALETRVENVHLIDPEFQGDREAITKHAMERFEKELHELMWETPALRDVARKLEAMLLGLDLPEAEARRIAFDTELAAAAEKSELRSAAIDVFLPAGREDPAIDKELERTRDEIVKAGVDAEIASECVAWYKRYLAEWKSVEALRAHFRSALASEDCSRPAVRKALDEKLREMVRKIFMAKLEMQWNPLASGNQTIDFICRRCPPGYLVHVHGAQNIKGPGLDWCYRWISLEKVVEATKKLEDERAWVRYDALVWLTGYAEFGIMDAPLARAAIEKMMARPENQEMNLQTQAKLALAHVAKKYEEALASLVVKEPERGRIARFFAKIGAKLLVAAERFLEAGDSKYRRRAADAILRDLVDQRISHERAAIELRDLMKRQKGGWLEKRLRAMVGTEAKAAS